MGTRIVSRLKRESSLKWLYPGLGVKRWLALLLFSITLISLGFGYLLRDLYTVWKFPPFFYYLSLQFIPRWGRALLFGAVGGIGVVVALIQLSRSLLMPFLRPGKPSLVDTLYQHRQRERGPKVVALGGGTGLSTLLRGLKEYTTRITAIVTVADNGGSSGLMRRELGVLPPGDFRNCIAALADAEELAVQLFQYRFGQGMGLNGHSFGNLFIAAMAGVTGSFEQAILESSRVLAVQGRILPSTLQDVTLCADLSAEGATAPDWVAGESQITATQLPIERVFLRPDGVRAYPEALRVILDADLIVAGPGSLFTSVIPNLLVEDIAKAVHASPALKVFVCNVANQPGETDGFTLNDHVAALERHVGHGAFPYVLVNRHQPPAMSDHPEIVPVPLKYDPGHYQVLEADLVDENNPWRHDPGKLARELIAFYESHTRR
ncbi:MAG: uridine diphosphate-N-acetylglucosamine-binding protein YvcK [Chloroflexota bacterium]|nr:uridine diphosphate-N-acetylglucosamine-binding protein YvcK [Chloroflexota bacterium]